MNSLLGKAGKIGYGLKEFQYPDLTKQFHYDKDNNSLVITMYDVSRRRFTKINLSSVWSEILYIFQI